MMTSAQIVETSVTTTDNSPFQDYTHLDDYTTQLHVIILDSSSLTLSFTYFDVELDHLSRRYLHVRPQIL